MCTSTYWWIQGTHALAAPSSVVNTGIQASSWQADLDSLNICSGVVFIGHIVIPFLAF